MIVDRSHGELRLHSRYAPSLNFKKRYVFLRRRRKRHTVFHRIPEASVKHNVPVVQPSLQQDKIFQIYLAVVIEIKDCKVDINSPFVEVAL